MDKFFEANKTLWDAKTPHHLKSDFYDLDAFKKGKNVLREIELDALGNVEGKSLLHLQCHFGQDTLCWSRMGAKCTGVDFSTEAVKTAKALNSELGLDAHFVEANVLEIKEHLEGQFDIVYTSYGVIGWLPDLTTWAENICHFLKPGGTFFIAEFHPFLYTLDWDKLTLAYDYFNQGKPDHEVTDGTYADREADLKYDEYFWPHSFQEILTGLLDVGLELESFREFPWSPYPCFPNVESVGENRWQFKGLSKQIPYVFSLKMKKRE